MTYSSFSAIIDAFGGSLAFCKVIGKPLGTTSAMKTRDVIPPLYWQAVVTAGAQDGLDISYELLSRLYAARRWVAAD